MKPLEFNELIGAFVKTLTVKTLKINPKYTFGLSYLSTNQS